jgi:hypothetical protein
VLAQGVQLQRFMRSLILASVVVLPRGGAEEASEAPQAAARRETRKERRAQVGFHKEAARSQVRALDSNLNPFEKPLRHASIRTRVSPSRGSVHMRWFSLDKERMRRWMRGHCH